MNSPLKNSREYSFQDNNYQLLSLLYEWLLESDNINAVFLLRNRQPVFTSSPVGYIEHFISESYPLVKVKFPQQVLYSDYLEIQRIVYNQEISTIRSEDRSKNFIEEIVDDDFLISPVYNEKYNWGAIICALPNGETLKPKNRELLRLTSRLMSVNCKSILDREVQDFKLQNINGKLKQRVSTVEQLLKELNPGKKNFLEYETGQVKWSNLKDTGEINEVWLSLQGYKDNIKDPVISRWIRLKESSLSNELINLFEAD